METHGTTIRQAPLFRGAWLLVLVLTFIAYARTLSFSFVHDDVFHLFGDPRLQTFRSISGFFTEHLWDPLFDEGSYYRPIILLWFLIQKSLFDANAFLWHLASIGVHLCATALVHKIAQRLLIDRFSAAFAALAFGLHPVHIESVAWISGSVDPLMATFALAAYACFFRWYDAPISARSIKVAWLLASVIFYALAQLTKETAIVLPGIIFCTAFLVDPKSGATLISRLFDAVRATLPYLLCAGLYFVVRFVVLGGLLGNTGTASVTDLLFTLPGILVEYALHLIFPFQLSPVYDTPYITSFSWVSVGVPLTLVVVAGVGAVYWSRRSTVVALAVVWMIFPLLPVLNLALLPEPDRFHDRFLYLPSVGFALLIGLAISKLKITGPRAFGAPVARLVAAVLICAPLALGTAIQSAHWKDDLKLFTRAAAVAPGNNSGLNNLGKELIKRGRLDEAEGYLQKVISRAPEHASSLLNLGNLYFIRGRFDKAERYLLRALKSKFNDPDVYIQLGFVRARIGKPDLAEADFRRAISFSRNRPGYGNALGVFLRNQGRFAEALEVFESELSLDPSREDVRQQVEKLRTRINRQ